MKKIEYTENGKIKDFSVPDAHHLYITAISAQSGMVLRKEAVELWELNDLITMPKDLKKQWAITKEVIQALLENGDCVHHIPGFPIRFEYVLKPMKYRDNLRHRG